MEDRWGVYHILSGLESPETCFWCGKPCKNRYCSAECKHNYLTSFHWKEARALCLQKAGFKCQQCGKKALKSPDFKVMNYDSFVEELKEYNKPIISQNEYNHIAFDFLCNSEFGGSYYHRAFRRLKNIYKKENDENIKAYHDSLLEIHHINPINGGRRDWSVLNRPENLMCLCRKCHKAITKESEG